MFVVYHSNQLDVLKALLAELLRSRPLADPMAAELILVQSPGMAQWLKQELAQALGIAANLQFPLPASFIWQMFHRVLPEVPEDNPYTKPAMSWRLMQRLPGCLARPSFAPLAHYLSEDPDERKRYQLSQRIADVFDQYLVYRPDWIADWEQGGSLGAASQPWQPELWRALVQITERQASHIHRANLFATFIERLDRAPPEQPLPERIFVFGISTLPPHYLAALQALGQRMEVHFLLTNPCRYYWGDLIESWRLDQGWLRQLLARRRTHLAAGSLRPDGERALFASDEDLARLYNPQGELAEGNPLLVSLGKQGRDHLSLLAELQPREIEAFVEVPARNLLSAIQHDILELRDRRRSGERWTLSPDDDSLVLHGCHSPMREVEVLHDELLKRFAADPGLRPREVVVMVADINRYSPYIQAVFGSAPAERHIPFSISDRSAQQENPLLLSVLQLLGLPEARCSAPELLELLAVPAVLARFDLTEADLTLLRRWVQESGVRWGLDEADAARFELQQMPSNTWRFGLDRLLLGYACDQLTPFAGILPYVEIEGQEAELLGRLARFIRQIRVWRDDLPRARSLLEWVACLDELLLDFYAPDEEDEAVLALVRQAMQALKQRLQSVDYPAPLTLGVLRDYLRDVLTNLRGGQQFLAGRVNFCTLMPMRSIPFRLVCLLGMNDGIYPRSVPPLGFDLMAQAPRRGDRSRREDDRYLFLEALLAAQERLYLSYVARSPQDNSEQQPSVLVSELLDYCRQSFLAPGCEADDEEQRGRAVERCIRREHPLVPYDARYFAAEAPASYAAEWLPLLVPPPERQPFLEQPLPLPEEARGYPDIELAELLRFYRNPVGYFFQRVLRVHFSEQEAELEEDEPFALDVLQRYQLKESLLAQQLQAAAPAALRARWLGSGQLPVGAFGSLLLEEEVAAVAPLVQSLPPLLQGEPERLRVQLTLGRGRLLGSLAGLHQGRLVRYRPGRLHGAFLLRTWIEHLCLCAGQADAQPSELLGLDKGLCRLRLRPVAAAQAGRWLDELLAGYLEGLTRPLAFFPKSGWCWLNQAGEPAGEQWLRSEDEARLRRAEQQAEKQFSGTDFVHGESEDPSIRRCFPRWDETLSTELQQWAEAWLGPLSCHLEDTGA